MGGKPKLKSKTLNINLIMGAIVACLAIFEINVPAEVQSGTILLVNYILRFFTKEPLK